MLDLNNYQLVADLSNNKLRKNGFSFGCYRRSVYKNTIEFRLYIDLEEQDVFYQVFDSDHNQLYVPYYNREYGNNKIVKEIDRKINRIMNTMVNQKILKKTKEEENKTMKLQKQIILDNVDKVKAFVVTVSKYPGDATLVSGRYVVDAKSIMGIFSLALNQPIDFTYEGELAADLAKEVQVYESQEV